MIDKVSNAQKETLTRLLIPGKHTIDTTNRTVAALINGGFILLTGEGFRITDSITKAEHIDCPVVYKTINTLNNKIYVGKDGYNRPKYLGSGMLLKTAMYEIGMVHFKKEILEYCSFQNVYQREAYWIQELQSQEATIGYNIVGSTKNKFGNEDTVEYKEVTLVGPNHTRL